MFRITRLPSVEGTATNITIPTRWAVTAALVAGGMLTGACGTDKTASETPENPPVEARIYPPTDVPDVRPSSTPPGATDGLAVQDEKSLRGLGGRAVMP